MATPKAELVRVESVDRVVTITLDSPTNRNALSRRLVAELDAALDAAAGSGAHAVLLTHTGAVFCSGAALDEMLAADDPGAGTRDLLALLRRLLTLPVPVVARVDGAVRAGGLGLLGCCDIVLAGGRASFAFTEARLGLAPAVVALPLRPLLAPRAFARYVLTAETFDAARAAEIGLVTAAGPDVDALVAPVLDALRAADRQGLRESRALTTRDRLRAVETEGPAMAELSARLFASEPARAHLAAFLTARPRQEAR